MSLSGLFGANSGGTEDVPMSGGPMAQSSLLSIDPKYLNNEYITMEDQGPEKSRFQTMTTTVGVSTIAGGTLGALQSIRLGKNELNNLNK